MRQTRTQRTAWYRTAVDHTKLKLLAQTDNTTGLLYLSGFILMLSISGFFAFLSIFKIIFHTHPDQKGTGFEFLISAPSRGWRIK